MNNRGIELAVNFFVTLILTLVVLGIGIYLARDLFTASTDITQDSFDKLDRQTESLFCQGTSQVCIGRDTVTLGRDSHFVFTIHIINVLTPPINGIFTIQAQAGPWFSADGASHPASTNPLLFFPDTRSEMIKNTEEKSFGIAVQRGNGMTKGTYTLDVEVSDPGGEPYGGKQRLNVKLA